MRWLVQTWDAERSSIHALAAIYAFGDDGSSGLRRTRTPNFAAGSPIARLSLPCDQKDSCKHSPSSVNSGASISKINIPSSQRTSHVYEGV